MSQMRWTKFGYVCKNEADILGRIYAEEKKSKKHDKRAKPAEGRPSKPRSCEKEHGGVVICDDAKAKTTTIC